MSAPLPFLFPVLFLCEALLFRTHPYWTVNVNSHHSFRGFCLEASSHAPALYVLADLILP